MASKHPYRESYQYLHRPTSFPQTSTAIMSDIANLADTHSFPPFALCPVEDDITSGFYKQTDDYVIPSRHWCIFAEITANDETFRISAIDRSGKEILIFFAAEVARAFPIFPIGHTVAILYPTRRRLEDGTEWLGVWVRRC